MPINPLDALISTIPVESEIDYYRWGTVQDDGMILLDTDTQPLADNPPSLVQFAPGDRVYVQIHNLRPVVLGKSYPTPFLPPEISSTTTVDGQDTT